MLEVLGVIPEWLGAGICAVLGWVGHILYSSWKNHIKPYAQDKERYEQIIKSIDPYSIEECLKMDIVYFNDVHFSSLTSASSEMDLIDKFGKNCLDKALKENERALVSALDRIINFRG